MHTGIQQIQAGMYTYIMGDAEASIQIRHTPTTTMTNQYIYIYIPPYIHTHKERAHTQTGRQAYIQTYRQAAGNTYRQTNIHTSTPSQPERHPGIQIIIQRGIHTHIHTTP